jgi:hypothetical protein
MHSSQDLGGRPSADENADQFAVHLTSRVSPSNDGARLTGPDEGHFRHNQVATLSC